MNEASQEGSANCGVDLPNLAHLGWNILSPMLESAIANAIAVVEHIMAKIDAQCPSR